MNTIRVGFTGTQEGLTKGQHAKLSETLRALHAEGEGISHFHHGDCIGADSEAHGIVRALFSRVFIVGHIPEKNDKRGFNECDEERIPLPYLTRNRCIVDEVDVMIACPKEREETVRSGTWSTVRYAREIGRRLIIVFPQEPFVAYSDAR